ncbi:MAG: hypothetical protein HY727_07140 [Candidatus Rokubacteria bacterium]|nr:hypothetical protein [Candidatus Rokubacteria bacterium]
MTGERDVDADLLKRIAKELAQLKIRVGLLQHQLAAVKHVDPEELDRLVENELLSRDGRYVYEATLLALKGQAVPPPPE